MLKKPYYFIQHKNHFAEYTLLSFPVTLPFYFVLLPVKDVTIVKIKSLSDLA